MVKRELVDSRMARAGLSLKSSVRVKVARVLEPCYSFAEGVPELVQLERLHVWVREYEAARCLLASHTAMHNHPLTWRQSSEKIGDRQVFVQLTVRLRDMEIDHRRHTLMVQRQPGRAFPGS